jgi:hypothetical protein
VGLFGRVALYFGNYRSEKAYAATEEVVMSRPDAKEAELSASQGERSRLSKEELEIEKVRQFNYSRRGFSQMF